jgi:hypothetical protein
LHHKAKGKLYFKKYYFQNYEKKGTKIARIISIVKWAEFWCIVGRIELSAGGLIQPFYRLQSSR